MRFVCAVRCWKETWLKLQCFNLSGVFRVFRFWFHGSSASGLRNFAATPRFTKRQDDVADFLQGGKNKKAEKICIVTNWLASINFP